MEKHTHTLTNEQKAAADGVVDAIARERQLDRLGIGVAKSAAAAYNRGANEPGTQRLAAALAGVAPKQFASEAGCRLHAMTSQARQLRRAADSWDAHRALHGSDGWAGESCLALGWPNANAMRKAADGIEREAIAILETLSTIAQPADLTSAVRADAAAKYGQARADGGAA